MTDERYDLSREIMDFLDRHAGTSASYDPDFDEAADRYSSPDASEMHFAASRLAEGCELDRVPFSEWGSGGYHPYSDQDARRLHDEIVKRTRKHVRGSTPRGS